MSLPEEDKTKYYPRWPLIYDMANKIDELLNNSSKELAEKKEIPITLDEVELIVREITKIANENNCKWWTKEQLLSEGLIDKPSPQMNSKPVGNHYL